MNNRHTQFSADVHMSPTERAVSHWNMQSNLQFCWRLLSNHACLMHSKLILPVFTKITVSSSKIQLRSHLWKDAIATAYGKDRYVLSMFFSQQSYFLQHLSTDFSQLFHIHNLCAFWLLNRLITTLLLLMLPIVTFFLTIFPLVKFQHQLLLCVSTHHQIIHT